MPSEALAIKLCNSAMKFFDPLFLIFRVFSETSFVSTAQASDDSQTIWVIYARLLVSIL